MIDWKARRQELADAGLWCRAVQPVYVLCHQKEEAMAEEKRTTSPKSLTELSAALIERALSMTVHPTPDGFVVWLFAADDPALGIFPGEALELQDAVAAGLVAWDGWEIEAEAEGSEKN